MTIIDKDQSRKTWFASFDQWQSAFSHLLVSISQGADTRTEGAAFLRKTMVPWMDDAKDRLLRDLAGSMMAMGEKAKRLDALVNK
jgi:hypothetical protein